VKDEVHMLGGGTAGTSVSLALETGFVRHESYAMALPNAQSTPPLSLT